MIPIQSRKFQGKNSQENIYKINQNDSNFIETYRIFRLDF